MRYRVGRLAASVLFLAGASLVSAGEVFQVADVRTGPGSPIWSVSFAVARDRLVLSERPSILDVSRDANDVWLYDPDGGSFTLSPAFPRAVVAWKGDLLLGIAGSPGARASLSPGWGLCRMTVDGRSTRCLYEGNVVDVVPLAERALFLAQTGAALRLGATDGTADGTALLPAPTLLSPTLSIAGGAAFFLAGDGEVALWRSDGTAAGTRRLAKLPASASDWKPVAAGRLVFFAVGTTLWASDGTASGTAKVSRALTAPASLVPARDRLYFGGVVGRKPALFVSDGTSAGTFAVTTLTRKLQGGAAVGRRLLFSGATKAMGAELWMSDGTARGTRLLKEVLPGRGGGEVRGFASIGRRVVFLVGGAQSYTPWASDGTPSGTIQLRSGGIPVAGGFSSAGPGMAIVCGNTGCLRTDGTPGGTHFASGVEGSFVGIVGHSAVFARTTPVGRLWSVTRVFVSDGTASGTGQLDPPQGDAGSDPVLLQVAGDRLAFVAGVLGPLLAWNGQDFPERIDPAPFDQVAHAADRLFISGCEGMWRVDTSPPERLWTAPTTALVATASRVFVTQPGETSRDLVVSDGTVEGTRRVGPITLRVLNPTGVGDGLFWLNWLDSHRAELWHSDGTAAGTRRAVSDVLVLGDSRLPALGGEVYFAPADAPDELWASDGTAGSERRVAAAGAGSKITAITAAETGVFFLVDSGGPGPTLWWSDGSPAVTGPVAELPAPPEPIAAAGTAAPLTAAGGIVVFGVEDAAHGFEPWRSDGTPEGTGLLADLCPGPCSSFPTNATWTGSRLAFAAVGSVDRGVEAWLSDGTAEGTFELPEIGAGVRGSNPEGFVDFGDLVVFSADDHLTGRELWAYRP